ncbi:MAG: DoxX family protein [Bacteroidia bacterium]|jgi:hypothetical protein|nr:DoxX family protein [Bacteroidia bacterium]
MKNIGEYIAVSYKMETDPLLTAMDGEYWAGVIIMLICCAIFAIVFVQSAADKVFNYKGNLEWLKGHFAATPFKNSVPLLFALLTVLESIGGLCCAAGVLFCWTSWGGLVGLGGLLVCTGALLCLLLGQRLAKDYAGAASLMGYFIVALLGIIGAGMSGIAASAALYFLM